VFEVARGGILREGLGYDRNDVAVVTNVTADHLDEAMSYLSSLGIHSLVSHPPTLEELFLRQYGDEVPG
jgi:UDP-N-acetylmuramyl tripeptide synthase